MIFELQEHSEIKMKSNGGVAKLSLFFFFFLSEHCIVFLLSNDMVFHWLSVQRIAATTKKQEKLLLHQRTTVLRQYINNNIQWFLEPSAVARGWLLEFAFERREIYKTWVYRLRYLDSKTKCRVMKILRISLFYWNRTLW